MLTLQHFILRQKALNLYKSAIRASRSIPEPIARRDTIAWIRVEFERNRNVRDVEQIKNNLASIRRELKLLLPSMGLPSGKW